MVIIDTTVWIDYLRQTDNRETQWLDYELRRQRLGITDLILCEVLQGIRDQGLFRQVRDEMLSFRIFETGGTTLSLAAATNYRSLRERGLTVRKTIDCLIATFCMQHDHQLLHRDRDFDPFEQWLGLRVIHA